MELRYSRKVVLPLASVAGAAVLAVATGLPLSSASEGDGVRLSSVEGGGATLSVTALDPGDSVTRTVTIRNTTGAPARLSFTERGGPSTFADGELLVEVEHDGTKVYAGPFGAMGDFAQDMGFLEAEEATTFSFTVSLPDDADAAAPGTPAAEVAYSWETTQQ